MQGRRACIIAPAFAPDFFSEAIVNSKLALALLDAGWDLSVFSSSGEGQSYSRDWEEPWYRLKGVTKAVDSTRSSRSTDNALSFIRDAFQTPHRIANSRWALSVARLALHEHQIRPFDLIISRSTSCVAHLPAMIMRSRADIPWIANWNDPPSYKFPPPYQQHIGAAERFLRERYLRAAAAQADVSTFPTAYLSAYLKDTLRLTQKSRVEIIPHIGLGRRAKAKSFDGVRFCITHAGNLSEERRPELFLRALARFAQRHPNLEVEFRIIGHVDVSTQRALDTSQLRQLVSLQVVGALPYEDCQRALADADVLLLLEAPCDTGIFLPSKLTEYAEASRPIFAVSPKQGTVRDLNERFKFGVVADCTSEVAIENGLEDMFSRHIQIERHGSSGQLADYFAPDRIVSLLEDALDRISHSMTGRGHRADLGGY